MDQRTPNPERDDGQQGAGAPATQGLRCAWCPEPAVGTVFEYDHMHHVVGVTPACERHGEEWDGTSVLGRTPCWFDRRRILPSFRVWAERYAEQNPYNCTNDDVYP